MFSVQDLLLAMRHGTILDALNAGLALRRVGRLDGQAIEALSADVEHGDATARVLALHALAPVREARFESLFRDALTSEDRGLREHAAWALGDRPPDPRALSGLIAVLGDGGFGGMLAQLTLERWGGQAGAHLVAGALAGALSEATAQEPRVRYAETLELLRAGRGARPVGRWQLQRGRSRLRIGQVMLQGRLDGELRGSGAGDGGGLATLLVGLSHALDARPEVAEVVTYTRAFVDPSLPEVYRRPTERLGLRSSIERFRFGPEGYLATADQWPYRARIERELERSVKRRRGLDVVHLRFADVGTFAAARVFDRLRIPVVFTLAPDPHAVLRDAESAGELSRDGFVTADLEHHYLFRARLVDWMLHHADGLALLPRSGRDHDLRTLLGPSFDAALQRRTRTIPEGIAVHPRAGRRARTPAETVGSPTHAVDALSNAIRGLPRARRGLPLLVTVGRLHRVKNIPFLVEAWAGDRELFAAFNVVVVGGDLERPTAEEQAVLDGIRAVCRRTRGARDGLVLLGHRPNGDVPRLLDAAARGIRGLAAAGGVYACASRKEEFGIALLEALAAGLSAVAPNTGGPPTYIDDGRTGFLADTMSVEGLRLGLRRAAAARLDEARAARARKLVTERFTVAAMAGEVVELYRAVAGSSEAEAA